MPQPTEERVYTIEDIYALPEGQRAELIDGHIYYMAAPSITHQEISSFLHVSIGSYIRSRKGTCKIYAAPFAVFLNADDSKYLESDLSIICDKDKLTGRGCMGAPDWIIEIVSPSSVKMDYNKKMFLYRMAGVREYWIIDPEDNSVLVYDFENGEIMRYTLQDKVQVGIYEDLTIDFSELTL